MDLVISPATVALNPQQGAALPALRAGDVVEAQVLQSVGDAAKIAIGNTILEVLTQVALTPGSTVKLAVSNTPQGLRLTLVGNSGGGGGGGGGGGAGSATSAAGATNAAGGANPASTAAAASPPNDSAGPAVTVRIPGVGAVPSSAPQVAAPAGETPSADPASAPIAGSPANTTTGTPNNVTAAVTTTDPQVQAPASQPNPVVAATAALAAAVQSSAARQGGLGPLFADAGVAATVPGVPEPVRQAAERLLALPPTLDETTSADGIKQALERSGLFFEAHFSAEANGGSAPTGSADDLKAALVVLRNAVKAWLTNDLPIASADVATPGLGGTNARAAIAPAPDPSAPNAQSPQSAPPRAPATPASAPPPPYRGAPTAGQPAAAPSISADTAPRDIGRVLLNETDAALARQTLLQAASLPDSASANGAAMRSNDPTGPRWLFEVPFATPQGAAVAQFEISRDGHQAPAAGSPAVAWRARFSLDVEPIGPVHAQIALIGSRAAVTLWAERPETSAKLRDNAPELADALRQAELDPGDVLVRAGSPPRPREAVASGRFLDRAS